MRDQARFLAHLVLRVSPERLAGLLGDSGGGLRRHFATGFGAAASSLAMRSATALGGGDVYAGGVGADGKSSSAGDGAHAAAAAAAAMSVPKVREATQIDRALLRLSRRRPIRDDDNGTVDDGDSKLVEAGNARVAAPDAAPAAVAPTAGASPKPPVNVAEDEASGGVGSCGFASNRCSLAGAGALALAYAAYVKDLMTGRHRRAVVVECQLHVTTGRHGGASWHDAMGAGNEWGLDAPRIGASADELSVADDEEDEEEEERLDEPVEGEAPTADDERRPARASLSTKKRPRAATRVLEEHRGMVQRPRGASTLSRISSRSTQSVLSEGGGNRSDSESEFGSATALSGVGQAMAAANGHGSDSALHDGAAGLLPAELFGVVLQLVADGEAGHCEPVVTAALIPRRYG